MISCISQNSLNDTLLNSIIFQKSNLYAYKSSFIIWKFKEIFLEDVQLVHKILRFYLTISSNDKIILALP
jgi:hypothetical protein